MKTINKSFDALTFLATLTSFGERQYQGEIKAADFLEAFLTKHQYTYEVQKFKTTIPLEKKAILKADGKNIPCKSVCFHSGNITSKVTICSSLSEIPNFDKIQSPIIVFNPYCEQISRQIFFLNAPAIAIKYRDVNKVLVAKRIEGKVVIEPTTYTARNILVGNTKNPKNICFAHYDSWYYGAWDNGGGVATLMGTIFSNPNLLKETLFVFWANEEISYDRRPAYRCKGARMFEKKYLHLLVRAKKIIVIDGIGKGLAQWVTSQELTSVFWINQLKELQHKIKRLGNVSENDISFYHSELDTIDTIQKKYIQQAINTLVEEIQL